MVILVSSTKSVRDYFDVSQARVEHVPFDFWDLPDFEGTLRQMGFSGMCGPNWSIDRHLNVRGELEPKVFANLLTGFRYLHPGYVYDPTVTKQYDRWCKVLAVLRSLEADGSVFAIPEILPGWLEETVQREGYLMALRSC